MSNLSLLVCALVMVSVVVAKPKPGFADQIKDIGLDSGSLPGLGDMGLDTGSIPDFGSMMCKNSAKGKAGFPGMDKIPGLDKLGGSDCTTTAKSTDSGNTTEAATTVIVVTESS